jgi:hypothetical protein
VQLGRLLGYEQGLGHLSVAHLADDKIAYAPLGRGQRSDADELQRRRADTPRPELATKSLRGRGGVASERLVDPEAKHLAVEIPAVGRYHPFYNPGGPGNDPTNGVRYTSPGPSQVQPVIDALHDPMTVTFIASSSLGPDSRQYLG